MILEIYQYKVLTSNDGTDAIATYAINKDRISLVVMDLMMPNLDGLATIKALRKINSAIKLMAVTGLITSDLADEVRKQNVPLIAKPFTAQKLLKYL
ncbi:MAG: response regulator [Blastocatellia bacterium]|nr:response regulator [Blastocatellia bacterium]